MTITSKESHIDDKSIKNSKGCLFVVATFIWLALETFFHYFYTFRATIWPNQTGVLIFYLIFLKIYNFYLIYIHSAQKICNTKMCVGIVAQLPQVLKSTIFCYFYVPSVMFYVWKNKFKNIDFCLRGKLCHSTLQLALSKDFRAVCDMFDIFYLQVVWVWS